MNYYLPRKVEEAPYLVFDLVSTSIGEFKNRLKKYKELKYAIAEEDLPKNIEGVCPKDVDKTGKLIDRDNTQLVESRLKFLKDDKIKELVKYSNSKQLKSSVINGNTVWLNYTLRNKLLQRLNAETGQNTSALFFLTQEKINRHKAIDIINKIEIYSAECYDIVEIKHKENIKKLKTIAEVKSYNFKKGFPSKLAIQL